jgi:integrase
LEKSPAVNVHRLKVPESEKPHLTIEEVRRLAETPLEGTIGENVKRAFLFACYTGLRISDIRTLTWADVQGTQVAKTQYKTGVRVFVPLNDTAQSFLGDRGEPGDFVFPALARAKSAGNAIVSRWGRAAKVSIPLGWHTARHTFAVLALESGADIYTVSKLLGHTSVKTTEIYARATDKLRREAVQAMPGV